MDSENSYVIDTESAAEMARMLDQDTLMTRALDGLLPEPVASSFKQDGRLLDLGCGPGGWVQEVLYAFPEIEVVGVDISKTMIAYAQAQARVQHLEERVEFRVVDITALPWDFPDASFDLVNARFMAGFLRREVWPQIVREALRVLKPGGYLVLAEPEWSTSNSAAGERLADMAVRSFHRAGLGFSIDGRSLGIIHQLDSLLRDTGGEQIGLSAHILNMTYGRDFYVAGTKNSLLAYHFMVDFFVKTGVASNRQEVVDLCQQYQADIYQETFCAAMIMARAWCCKP
jgi:SAM-dependent methyltransferase